MPMSHAIRAARRHGVVLCGNAKRRPPHKMRCCFYAAVATALARAHAARAARANHAHAPCVAASAQHAARYATTHIQRHAECMLPRLARQGAAHAAPHAGTLCRRHVASVVTRARARSAAPCARAYAPYAVAARHATHTKDVTVCHTRHERHAATRCLLCQRVVMSLPRCHGTPQMKEEEREAGWVVEKIEGEEEGDRLHMLIYAAAA